MTADTRNPAARVPATWLHQMVHADTPGEVAKLIICLAQLDPGCTTATVLWDLGADDPAQSEPPGGLTPADHALAQAAAATGVQTTSTDGCRIALPLFPTNPAVLLLAVKEAAVGERISEAMGTTLRLAGRHLQRALELIGLKRAVAGLERSERLQHALFAISDLAGSYRDMPEMLRGIHDIVGTLMYAENFFIVRHDSGRDSLRFLYYADVEDPEQPSDNLELRMSEMQHSLTWYLLRDGKPLTGSIEQMRSQVSGPLAFVGTLSQDWLGVPMLRDGHVEGAIVVQSYKEGIGFSADDLTLLEFVASHILTALERKLSTEDLEERVRKRTIEIRDANEVLQREIVERQRAERLQAALFHIAQLATTDISQSEFYSRLHAEVGELLNAENFFIALLTEDGESLDFPYYVDAQGSGNPSRPLGRGLSEYVLRHGKSVMCTREQMETLAREGAIDVRVSGPPSQCWLGVPLLVADEVIGLVVVQSYVATVAYAPADQELLGFVALQIAITLNRRRAAESLHQAYAQLEQRVQERTVELREEIGERQRVQEQLKHQVMHDPLTGLPNRGYLLDRLGRVLRQLKRDPARRCALLYLDVDRFKIINDSLGHLAGDQVLKEVANRLLSCVRDPDVVARLSGDEFAVLLEDVGNPDMAVRVAQRILTAVGAPLRVDSRDLEPSVSVGIAIGHDGYSLADEVLRDADLALYRAKSMGRKRFELFDESLKKRAVNVLAMEGELRVALQEDQFEPYFQPIVRLANAEVVGYEALIRWNHPTRGVIGPADFLKIAEDCGSIEAIDWRMFELSCRLATNLGHSRTFLTINVSPLHLRRTDFDNRLLDLLNRTGLSAARLLAEVTEGSLMDDPARVCATLERLRAAGVGAALDDFGTGYSSLSYLHSFPLRMLKIDRAFVAGLDPTAQNTSSRVVSAVLALAGALGLEVIAEGIETQEQLAALVSMGCEFGQGYLLGRPAPFAHWQAAEPKPG